MGFDLSSYKTVAERIDEFWSKYPEGEITTELVSNQIINLGTDDEPDFISRVTFKATARIPFEKSVDGYRVLSVGYAEETDTESKIAKYFENAETSAIGRCLANANFGVKNDAGQTVRPSREEMESAERAGEPVANKKSIFSKRR